MLKPSYWKDEDVLLAEIHAECREHPSRVGQARLPQWVLAMIGPETMRVPPVKYTDRPVAVIMAESCSAF